jgi:hypothetical protein
MESHEYQREQQVEKERMAIDTAIVEALPKQH